MKEKLVASAAGSIFEESAFRSPMANILFPDPARADSDGLICAGGDLSPARVLAAYRQGIFPYFDHTTPILWWSPDPRAIIELDGFHVSRRLARTLRSGKYFVTFDQAFDRVIRGCADRPEGTWITPEMISAYGELHRLGHAHSVEVWQEGELAGGVYGLAVGGLFAGESMFTARRDGSKIALAHLVEHLRQRGYTLFDVQYLNDHTASLGAIEIPRRRYLARLKEALARDVTFG
jgi:leucyl/phenylalanyl-tRNA--protein transferase